MTTEYGRSLQVTKAMLYSRKQDYKYFVDIKPEDIERIKAFADMKRKFAKKPNTTTGIEDKGALYKETMRAIVEPSISRVLKSYDEKIFFLINTVDPELKAFEMIRKAVIMPLSVIESIPNEKTKTAAMNLRRKQLDKLNRQITDELGFYDGELFQYEGYYRKMFVCDEEMLAQAQMGK